MPSTKTSNTKTANRPADVDGSADAAPFEAPGAGGFAELGLKDAVLTALAQLGYEEPTPIQREAIPLLLAGHDIIAKAATGTGKTAAFALPIVHRIDKHDAAIPGALVVVPTRELALQVSEAFFKYGRQAEVKVLPVFGGQPIGRQLDGLRRGVHVVVATPGRAIDHIKRGSLDLSAIHTVVLDEADEMLDMGFTDDIEAILEATPATRQTLLFSATMPPRIAKIAATYLRDPVSVDVETSQTERANPLIRQTVYMVLRAHKASALARVLDVESPAAALVFCRTRTEVDELTETMNGRGYRAEALHGGMDQAQRDRVMGRLRDGTAELLIATDVAARGLDVDALTHVVNYDVPSAPESYVHRIGRVGRAGREGVAITIAEPRQQRLLDNIERLTNQRFVVEKVPTAANLRAKQLEATVGALREAADGEDLDDYRSVLSALSGDFDDREVALAAIKLVHRARNGTSDDRDIPDAFSTQDRRSDAKSKHNDKHKGKHKAKSKDRDREFSGSKGFVYINVGKKAGLRPGDLVGAIANEAGLSGSEIGPIKISDHYAVVGVPERAVDDIVRSMKRTSIRGKKASVRRYED